MTLNDQIKVIGFQLADKKMIRYDFLEVASDFEQYLNSFSCELWHGASGQISAVQDQYHQIRVNSLNMGKYRQIRLKIVKKWCIGAT